MQISSCHSIILGKEAYVAAKRFTAARQLQQLLSNSNAGMRLDTTLNIRC